LASFRERVQQRLESEDLSLFNFLSRERIGESTDDPEEAA
jgi:hypothetical protein